MSPVFLIAAAFAALALAILIVWALRGSRQEVGGREAMKVISDAPRHLHHMAQIRQAMDSEDLIYALAKGGSSLAATLRRERRRVAEMYLAALRKDFEQALHIARVIAVLSPEISGPQEYERLKLTVLFRCRYQVVRTRLVLGNMALPQVTALGQMVTSLTADMETAMAALGERAALAVERAVQSER